MLVWCPFDLPAELVFRMFYVVNSDSLAALLARRDHTTQELELVQVVATATHAHDLFTINS